ncbi:RfaE ADP-heptose synthase, bifunctional sugar kinase/adenylyltransferase [Burkholderiales bacterium]
MDFSSARVLVVGDLMLDRYWMGDVDRISPEAPVPVVRIARQEERLGGAANVARNLASLGAKPMLMGVVGPDEAGRTLRQLLAQEGIEDRVIEDPAIATTLKLRVIGRQQQLVRLDFEAQPTHEALHNKRAEFERALAAVDLVVMSDYGKGGLTHIRDFIRMAREMGRPILVDPKGDDYARYAGATMLTPNRSEFFQVVGRATDEADFATRAESLRASLGLDHLLVTRSEDGMTLFSANQKTLHVPAQAREVFDVSGAGDTVIATLAAAMAAGLSVEAAVPLANRAGGIVVGKLGTAAIRHDELFSGVQP